MVEVMFMGWGICLSECLNVMNFLLYFVWVYYWYSELRLVDICLYVYIGSKIYVVIYILREVVFFVCVYLGKFLDIKVFMFILWDWR